MGVDVAIDDGRVGDAVADTSGVSVGPEVGVVWFSGVAVAVAGYVGTCGSGNFVHVVRGGVVGVV